jgi:hypothetical protein
MGKKWLRGTEEDAHPDRAHRRGGWCGVEAGRRELASGGYGGGKRTTRGLTKHKKGGWLGVPCGGGEGRGPWYGVA